MKLTSDAQMELDLRSIRQWLVQASKEIDSDYFKLPVAGSEEPLYRERVYCYELYHRWRCNWAIDSPYSLSGEIDKAGHPIIRPNVKPDFLVHIPGHMTNLLVVEVKPANALLHDIVKDLETLTTFRRGLGDDQNYFAGYFWIYGISGKEWGKLASNIVGRVQTNSTVDLQPITPAIHSDARHSVEFVTWS